MIQTKPIRGLSTGWIQQGPADASVPILLFLHGCPDSPEIWNAQIEHFSKDFLVIAPYLRGIGLSQPTDDLRRYGLEAMALDNLEILREVDPTGLRKVFVIGHDIGAIHAWHIASLLKKRLGGLIAMNGPSLYQMAKRVTNLRQLKKSWYIGLFQLPVIPEFLLKNASLLPRNRVFNQKIADKLLPFLGQYRQAVRSIPKILMNPPKAIKSPVLVLWGKNDPFLEVPSAEELRPLASNCTIRVLDAGHWVQTDAAVKINELVSSFLSDKLSV